MGVVEVVNKWKVIGITIAYWISMSIIARILWESTHRMPPAKMLQLVWTGGVFISAICFSIARRKWSPLLIGIAPYLLSSIPLIGSVSILAYVAHQTYSYEKDKLTIQSGEAEKG